MTYKYKVDLEGTRTYYNRDLPGDYLYFYRDEWFQWAPSEDYRNGEMWIVTKASAPDIDDDPILVDLITLGRMNQAHDKLLDMNVHSVRVGRGLEIL